MTRFPATPGAFFVCAFVLLASAIPSPAAAQAKKKEIPDPEPISLETKDGFLLKCTWYAGTKGKNSVPILMLHGLGGNRNEFAALASYLQEQGHAVLVPDLRGHGGSNRYKLAGDPVKVDEVKGKDYPQLFQNMVEYDIERCKKFLVEKNNEEELNIELLCVVAAEMGAVLALNWAVTDWNWPTAGTLKQGQDVKALVLLSPDDKIEKTKLNTLGPLQNPVVLGKAPLRLSIMIAVGQEDGPSNSIAKKMHGTLKRARPDAKDDPKKVDLFLDSYETKLQGTKLLDPKLPLEINGARVKLIDRIHKFIDVRLIARQKEFAWATREKF